MFAVLAPAVKLQPGHHRPGSRRRFPEAGAVFDVLLAIPGRHQQLDALAEHLGGIVTEQDLGLAIDEDHRAVRIGNDRGVG